MRGRRAAAIAASVSIALAGAASSGCGEEDEQADVADAAREAIERANKQGQAISEGIDKANKQAEELRVGSCTDFDVGEAFGSVKVVDCDSPQARSRVVSVSEGLGGDCKDGYIQMGVQAFCLERIN